MSQHKLRDTFKEKEFVPYKCNVCGLDPFWNGMPLVLTLDHINGKNKDNRIENLQWVCPNCDRQSETYGSRNKKKLEKGKIQYFGDYDHTKEDVIFELKKLEEIEKNKGNGFCIDCGKQIGIYSTRCKECSSIIRRKTIRPSKETLEKLLKDYNGSFAAISKIYGVTDNTIRKWCKSYQIPFHTSDYIKPKHKKETNPLVLYKVDQIDIKTGEVVSSFNSISEAERITGIWHITEASDPNNLKRRTAGGYMWRRKE